MTASDESGPKPEADPPDLLVGSRPSFMEIVGSQPSVREGPEGRQPKPRGVAALPEKPKSRSAFTGRIPVTHWLIIAASASIVFSSVWIAWSTYQLHDFALRQAKSINDSLEISRFAILAANRRAEAAEKAYDLALETSRNQLRAYISVLGIATQNAFEKNMASSLNYKNVGQTPALNMRVLTEAAIISAAVSDVKPPRLHPTSYAVDNSPATALGSDIAASDPINKTFKEAELEEFRTGTKIYTVWGIIYYSDVFGKSHYTRFCRFFKNAEFGRWALCQTGNDSN